MERDFWEARWRDGHTPWHADGVTPILERHAHRFAAGARVLVPLCGKSLDLFWLAGRGHEVIGVELVERAAELCFAEAGVEPTRDGDRLAATRGGERVTIAVADIFEVGSLGPPGSIGGVWDRGALIALPPSWRRRYADAISALAPGAPILMSTVHYDRSVMDGPPFSVDPDDLAALYPSAEILERPDIIEGSRWAELGHTWFESVTYWIR